MITYTPYDWYWIVAGDESRVWSSKASAYVSVSDATFQAWLDRGGIPTRIASEEELSGVLRPYGLRGPYVSLDDYKRAIQAHIDATAQQRDYDSGISCATYVNAPTPKYSAEAQAFIAWRDSVWVYAYTELDKVLNGQRQQPSVEAFLAELPEIQWPE